MPDFTVIFIVLALSLLIAWTDGPLQLCKAFRSMFRPERWASVGRVGRWLTSHIYDGVHCLYCVSFWFLLVNAVLSHDLLIAPLDQLRVWLVELGVMWTIATILIYLHSMSRYYDFMRTGVNK